jgi:hypothetical protein
MMTKALGNNAFVLYGVHETQDKPANDNNCMHVMQLFEQSIWIPLQAGIDYLL